MKNMILSVLIVLSVALLSAAAHAGNQKVLLISDVDDTIKVSHILSKTKSVARSINFTVSFTGMSQLYQLIINQNPKSTHVAYISNAPQLIGGEPIMKISHEAFLSYNHFPKGELLLRENLQEKNHKIKTIRQLVENFKPEIVIMVGDNGEQDVEIYDQATRELSAQGIRSATYIHQLYSSKNIFFEIGQKILPGQIGYVTPFEIALDLNNKNLLDKSSLDWMIQKIMPMILKEKSNPSDTKGYVTFPSFKNCSDFKWTNTVPPEMVQLADKINKKCR